MKKRNKNTKVKRTKKKKSKEKGILFRILNQYFKIYEPFPLSQKCQTG